MTPIHTEEAFEATIESILLEHGGYLKGNPVDYNRELALDPVHLFAFIEATQAKVWADLRAIHQSGLEVAFLDALCAILDTRGTLEVLRHGVKFYGKLIRLAYFQPASGLNPETLALYRQNRLTVTRQVHYSTHNENSIDLVLFVNGLPVVTMEVKNHLTGQTVSDAKEQYRHDRDPKERLFAFKQRALVHFAVDPDEVYMTTRLAKEKTFFLPFNKGHDLGAGNPPNPHGDRTAYLWEEVLTRDSLLDILHRFVHLEVNKKTHKETLIFPRYHQLDAVRQLVTDAQAVGAGKNYLVQHSAGSGKSNTIAWTAHRLASLHDAHNRKVFDSVIVITDRRVLDQQLQDTVFQFEHKLGVVQKIDKHSGQLAEAICSGAPIIITTLQKFPFVTEKVGELPDRTYAVIIDEAHSSQSGESAIKMKGVLAAKSLDDAARREAEAQGLEDYEERILKTMLARGRQENISFFAFTATPKYKTLEVFGEPGADGKPVPFHLYSMRQAIEERFILDVLSHYTTYKAYYRLIKQIEDDPAVERKKAARALARFMSLHPHNIAQKTEVMIEHFRAVTRHKIGGRAKAMVVTSSRLHAVRYKQAFDKYIAEKGYTDIRTLVAFSGSVTDEDNPAVSYTEVEMNGGIKERELPDKFATDDYQVLLVADKYQTGFDQPLLHTMYVDKRLSGIQAVQTLSRLNRTCAGKEDTFILDFVNEPEEIQEAFQPYYERTGVSEEVDPQHLYALQAKLDGFQIYHQQEIENFCKVFFAHKAKQTKSDHARLNAYLDPAVDRFKALDEEQQDEFKKALVSYLRLYSFLSQIIPYQDSDLEKLYAFGRFLMTKLPRRQTGPAYHFDDEVALKYYRLQKIIESSVVLEFGGEYTISGPAEVGTGKSHEEKVELSKLIDVLNQRFGTEFNATDQLVFDQFATESINDPNVRQVALANTFENFRLDYDRRMPRIMVKRMEDNQDIVTRYFNDDAFRNLFLQFMARQVYDHIRATNAQVQTL